MFFSNKLTIAELNMFGYADPSMPGIAPWAGTTINISDDILDIDENPIENDENFIISLLFLIYISIQHSYIQKDTMHIVLEAILKIHDDKLYETDEEFKFEEKIFTTNANNIQLGTLMLNSAAFKIFPPESTAGRMYDEDKVINSAKEHKVQLYKDKTNRISGKWKKCPMYLNKLLVPLAVYESLKTMMFSTKDFEKRRIMLRASVYGYSYLLGQKYFSYPDILTEAYLNQEEFFNLLNEV